MAVVTYDDKKCDPEKLAEEVTNVGFPSKVIQAQFGPLNPSTLGQQPSSNEQ